MLNLQQISKTDPILLPTLLKSIEDNRVFKKNDYRESFTKNINNLLSLRESRHSALLTLNLFCDHHSIVNSPLTEKTCQELNWIEQLLKVIEQDPQYHSECFEILGKLVRITSCNPDTNKIVQSKYVQKIIEAIVGSSITPQHSLDCLATCFELHGGTSGIYKNKIYDYCVSFVDVPDNNIAERGALCLHLLQQSRGGSVAGGVYKKCWAEFHERTIGSLETILEEIMRKGRGGNIGKSEQLQLPELKLSAEPFTRYTQLFVRFQNLITICRVSLQLPFPTPKTVQVSRLLSFIEDGIGTSQVLLGKKALSDSMVLSLLHGQIHINLLNVLVTLMTSLKQNVITHSKNICDILWRCLKQTNAHEQVKFEANLKLRAATYEAFIVFMRISPNNFYLKTVMENLMKEALIDVTPANNEIYLMMPQQNGGKSNKRKKVNAERNLVKGRTHVGCIIDEQKVCAKALECLGYLLVYHGALMKPVLFYIMQEKIISVGFMISSKVQVDGDLYRDPHCRSRLADLVGFLMIHPVNKMPVPINYGIALLSKIKQADPDSSVRDCAAMNLYRAETAIHNRKDVFYYPLDYKDFRDTLLFNKQTINKFNEATEALQKPASNGKQEETPEVVEESETILIADNISDENEDSIEQPVDEWTGKSLSKEQLDVTEISDDEAKEPVQEEPQVISDEELTPEPVAEAPILRTRSAEKQKRTLQSADPPTTPKKQKVSSKKDDEAVEELLADFNG